MNEERNVPESVTATDLARFEISCGPSEPPQSSTYGLG